MTRILGPGPLHGRHGVNAGDLWNGFWEKIDKFNIFVVIMHKSTARDYFYVFFSPYGDYFIAFKNDVIYRYGSKID